MRYMKNKKCIHKNSDFIHKIGVEEEGYWQKICNGCGLVLRSSGEDLKI